MKKLFLISVFLFICGWGGAQSQESKASVTITIVPPLDAIQGEIYCYCVEYFKARDSRKDSTFKRVYVTPDMNRKEQYIETSCIISNLTVGEYYCFQVLVFYCGTGYYGCGGIGMKGHGKAISIQRGKNEYLLTLNCGLIDYMKYNGPS